MVKLTHPLFWEGRLHEIGKFISLPDDLEKAMIRNKTAVSADAVTAPPSPPVPDKAETGKIQAEEPADVQEAEQLPLGRSLTK